MDSALDLSLQRESGLASARESLAAAGGEVRQSHAVCEDLLVQHRRLSEAYNPRVIKVCRPKTNFTVVVFVLYACDFSFLLSIDS